MNVNIIIEKIEEKSGGGYMAYWDKHKYAFVGDGETVEEAFKNLCNSLIENIDDGEKLFLIF